MAAAAAVVGGILGLWRVEGEWQDTLRTVLAEVFVGLATSSFLIGCTERLLRNEQVGWLGKLCASKAAVGVGHFSYSLYLCHYPLLAISFFALVELGVSSAALFVWLSAVGVPLVVFVAYFFYLAFERPFLASARFRPKATPVAPAPMAR